MPPLPRSGNPLRYLPYGILAVAVVSLILLAPAHAGAEPNLGVVKRNCWEIIEVRDVNGTQGTYAVWWPDFSPAANGSSIDLYPIIPDTPNPPETYRMETPVMRQVTDKNYCLAEAYASTTWPTFSPHYYYTITYTELKGKVNADDGGKYFMVEWPNTGYTFRSPSYSGQNLQVALRQDPRHTEHFNAYVRVKDVQKTEEAPPTPFAELTALPEVTPPLREIFEKKDDIGSQLAMFFLPLELILGNARLSAHKTWRISTQEKDPLNITADKTPLIAEHRKKLYEEAGTRFRESAENLKDEEKEESLTRREAELLLSLISYAGEFEPALPDEFYKDVRANLKPAQKLTGLVKKQRRLLLSVLFWHRTELAKLRGGSGKIEDLRDKLIELAAHIRGVVGNEEGYLKKTKEAAEQEWPSGSTPIDGGSKISGDGIERVTKESIQGMDN